MQHNIDRLSYTINCPLRQLKITDLRITLTFHNIQVLTILKMSSIKMLGMGFFTAGQNLGILGRLIFIFFYS